MVRAGEFGSLFWKASEKRQDSPTSESEELEFFVPVSAFELGYRVSDSKIGLKISSPLNLFRKI